MDLSQVLIESKESDFLQKYRSKFTPEEIKKIYLLSRELSSTHKFLDFLGKSLIGRDIDEMTPIVKDTIEKFVRYQSQLDEKDINKYGGLEEIISTIEKHQNKQRRGVSEVPGADIVFENDRFTIVTPKTHEASCYYGSGTKWCTSAIADTHFNTYNVDGKLFYIIDKTAKSSDDKYKVALLYKYDGQQSLWDVKDKQFSEGWILGSPEWNEMLKVISDYMNTEYAREIEIYKDKERAKEERERVRRQQERERRRQMAIAAERRRADDEWNLEIHEGDEDVEKVNAVFEVLVDDYRIVGEEEHIYFLIPSDFDSYGLTTFNWTGEDDYDSDYVVGTYEEVWDAAMDSLRSLYDDVGLDGWNSNFIESHIDMDKVEELFTEVYDNDVRENIEVYFDEEDRELSYEQEKQIAVLESEIEDLRTQIEETDDTDEVSELLEEIENKEIEIEDIRMSPEGDPSEDVIEDKVAELVRDQLHDPLSSLQDFGITDFSDYIDVEDLLEDSLNTDGIGHTLATYDGDEHVAEINGTDYYVYRVG